MNGLEIIYLLDLFGVIVFAISGSLDAGKKKMDVYGVVFVGMVTAIGGGTIRDLILGVPVFWASGYAYIATACGAAFLTFLLARCWQFPPGSLLIPDAFGLAIFTVIGTQKALSLGANPIIAITMGMMTSVFGGVIRDILRREIPLILQREIYATASILGGTVFVILSYFLSDEIAIYGFSALAVLALRLSAIQWNISLPVFSLQKETIGKVISKIEQMFPDVSVFKIPFQITQEDDILVGLDNENNIFIIEITDEMVDENVIPQVMKSSCWVETYLDAVKSICLEQKDKLEDCTFDWDKDFDIKIVIIGPSFKSCIPRLASRINYEVELVEFRKVDGSKNDHLSLNKIMIEEEEITKL